MTNLIGFLQSPWGSTGLQPALQKDDDKASTPAEVALELRMCTRIHVEKH